MPKCNGNLCNHESSLFFVESFHLIEMSEQLSALDKFHQEVYSEFVLKDIVHADYKRMLNSV